MAKWGGTGAESLKTSIDNIFGQNGRILLGDYDTKLVSCTADGASVNFGHLILSGLLTRLGQDRDWLLKIHCSEHKIELAVKSSFQDTVFSGVDEFYQANFNLLKHSGKISGLVKNAASSLNIQYYKLSKITGTRFVGHRVNGLKKLLAMWPAFLTAFENAAVDQGNNMTKAKVEGLLAKFRSYKMLCLACAYLDVLEKIGPSSKVFEEEGLLPFEVKPSVELSILQLNDCAECAGTNDEYLDSHLSRFTLQDNGNGNKIVKSQFLKAGHNLRALDNREYVTFTFENMLELKQESRMQASNAKKEVALELITLLKSRFADFQEEIYSCMIHLCGVMTRIVVMRISQILLLTLKYLCRKLHLTQRSYWLNGRHLNFL